MASTSSPFKYLSKLQGQSVLVLGGSSGIGFAVAEAAVEHGARVVISSSRQAKVDAALGRLWEHARATKQTTKDDDNDEATIITGTTCDVGDAETAEANLGRLLSFATRDGAVKLDHIVYTAGDAVGLSSVATTSVAEIQRLAMVRQFAAVLLAKLAPAHMVASVGSSLTLTAGSNAVRPGPNWSVVAGVGAAIEGHARGFAVDLRPIRVNVVRLGIIPTEFFDHIPQQTRDLLIESTIRTTLTGTVGRPTDAAEAYLYFMKDRFATGSIASTDGGILAGYKEF
jgi:NAD(P)-dependent dehydrogenase (short-subunit alcohol dehydrogenase family)